MILDAVENLTYHCDHETASSEALIEGWSIYLLNALSDQEKSSEAREHSSDLLLKLLEWTGTTMKRFLLDQEAPRYLLDITFKKTPLLDDNLVNIILAFFDIEEGRRAFITQGLFTESFKRLEEESNNNQRKLVRILSFFIFDQFAAVQFIQEKGLSYIMPLLFEDESERDESLLTIISQLFEHIPPEHDLHPVLVKEFTGDNLQRVHQLIKLHRHYLEMDKVKDVPGTSLCLLIFAHLFETGVPEILETLTPIRPLICVPLEEYLGELAATSSDTMFIERISTIVETRIK